MRMRRREDENRARMSIGRRLGFLLGAVVCAIGLFYFILMLTR